LERDLLPVGKKIVAHAIRGISTKNYRKVLCRRNGMQMIVSIIGKSQLGSEQRAQHQPTLDPKSGEAWIVMSPT
jgi:hypothetical protein